MQDLVLQGSFIALFFEILMWLAMVWVAGRACLKYPKVSNWSAITLSVLLLAIFALNFSFDSSPVKEEATLSDVTGK